MNSAKFLEAIDLHKGYHNGHRELRVLKGIDLAIDKGKFIAIVGPSGAGKSTLLHILGGLDMPTRGKVILEDQNIYGLSEDELCGLRNERIGFIFQFYHLLSEFTVLENVLMPALVGRNPPDFRRIEGEARELLKAVGLSERAAHFPSQLSGGEQQRVAIARALMNKPALLLCDEPTGNLDSKTGEGIVSLIEKINRQDQTAVVLVTHNLELAKAAEKIYRLKDGILLN